MKKRLLNITGSLGGGINSVVNSISKELSSIYSIDFYILRKTEHISILGWLKRFITIKKIMQNQDLIHYHGGWLMALALLYKKPKASLVISPHGALDRVSLKKSRYKKLFVKYIYMKRAYLNANIIHALTDKEAADIRAWGIDTPIEIIPNGIDFKDKLDINLELKRRLKDLSKDRRVFLSLSRVHKAKGIEILIDAFSLVDSREFCLFIVGEGSKEYISFLEHKIKKLSLDNSIFLLGPLYNEDKNSVYEISDIFILSSFNEGFPLTVLEAYRQKKAVITTTATPFKWIVENESGWYIKPTKSELKRVLEEALLKDLGELSTMGSNGFNYSLKNYNLNTITKRYNLMYSKLI